MNQTTPPQQFSFIFEEVTEQSTVVNLVCVAHTPLMNIKTDSAVVYDFQSAARKHKEATHASLYKQILDSVRHIG